MARDSRKVAEAEEVEWGPDTIEAEIRERVRGMIEIIVEEELESVLGAGKSQRVGRRAPVTATVRAHVNLPPVRPRLCYHGRA